MRKKRELGSVSAENLLTVAMHTSVAQARPASSL